VIVEGNSFLEYVTTDLAIMCARSEGRTTKGSARKALARSDLIYLSSLDATAAYAKEQFEEFCTGLSLSLDLRSLPIITDEDLPSLLLRIYRRDQARTIGACNSKVKPSQLTRALDEYLISKKVGKKGRRMPEKEL
jgi:hypothetical protein